MNWRRLLPLGVVIALLTSLVGAAGPALTGAATLSVTLKAAALPVYETQELTFSLPTTYPNPYDADAIDIRAVIQTPDGRTDRVAAFWYERVTYTPSAPANQYVTVPGSGVWMVRYAPRWPGAYTVTIEVREAGVLTATHALDPGGFTATPTPAANNHGYVRVDPLQPTRFVFDDGTPFVPLGANLAWDELTPDFGPSFAAFKQGKLNLARVWLSYLGDAGGHFVLEWTETKSLGGGDTVTWAGIGRYNQENAYKIDRLLEQARANDIHLLLSLATYTNFFTSTYDDNPYKPFVGTGNRSPFWTDPTARRHFRNYARYIGARYGGHTTVAMMELFNEVDRLGPPPGFPADPTAMRVWHEEMAAALQPQTTSGPTATAARVPLVTTSFAGQGKPWKDCPTYLGDWANPGCTGDASFGTLAPNLISVTQAHHFDKSPGASAMVWGWGDMARYAVSKFGRPYLLSEYGYDPPQNDWSGDIYPGGVKPFDKLNHHSTWAPILHGGAAGAALLWRIRQPQLSFVPPADFRANTARFATWLASEAPYLRQYSHVWSGEGLAGYWAGGFTKSNRAALYFLSKAATWDVADDSTLAPVTGQTYVLPAMAAGQYTVAWTDPLTGAPVGTAASITHPGGALTLTLPDFRRDLAVKVYTAETPPVPTPLLLPGTTITPTPTATATPTVTPTLTVTPTPTATTAPGQPTPTPTATSGVATPTAVPGGGGGGPLPQVTWYFAEGYTGAGFDEYLTIQNPGATAGTATIDYYVEGESQPVTRVVPLAAGSRTTVVVHGEQSPANPGGLGRREAGHATRVLATVPVIVERPMYFSYGAGIDGGHSVLGATALGRRWLFAEGYTGAGFDEFLTILNAGDQAGQATITYYIAGQAGPTVRTLNLPARSRTTVAVHDANAPGGLGRNQAHATTVETTVDTVVERPMYFAYGVGIDGGHNVIGAAAGATSWYFAEGYTGPGFDEYLTIQNPHASPVQATVTYYGEGQAQPVVRTLTLPATSRTTVAVHEDPSPGNPAGLGRRATGHATRVDAGLAIVVERPIYFLYGATVTGGHNVLGARAPRTDWYFAEGYTGQGFDEYLTIQNPGPTSGTALVTYYLEGASGPSAQAQRLVSLPAGSRVTVAVHRDYDPTANAGGLGRQARGHATKLISTVPVIVERPMYFTYNGGIDGGHNVLGFAP